MMMKLYLMAILYVLTLAGCTAEDSHYLNGYKYWIFISDDFTPEFKEIKKGDIFGDKNSLLSGQISDFGKIEVIWDDKVEAIFHQEGSYYMTRNKGKLKLTGELKKPLQVIIIKATSKTSGKVIDKIPLPAGSFKLKFNCE